MSNDSTFRCNYEPDRKGYFRCEVHGITTDVRQCNVDCGIYKQKNLVQCLEDIRAVAWRFVKLKDDDKFYFDFSNFPPEDPLNLEVLMNFVSALTSIHSTEEVVVTVPDFEPVARIYARQTSRPLKTMIMKDEELVLEEQLSVNTALLLTGYSSSGEKLLSAIEQIRKNNVNIHTVLSLVDYNNGANELLEKNNCFLRSLLEPKDILGE